MKTVSRVRAHALASGRLTATQATAAVAFGPSMEHPVLFAMHRSEIDRMSTSCVRACSDGMGIARGHPSLFCSEQARGMGRVRVAILGEGCMGDPSSLCTLKRPRTRDTKAQTFAVSPATAWWPMCMQGRIADWSGCLLVQVVGSAADGVQTASTGPQQQTAVHTRKYLWFMRHSRGGDGGSGGRHPRLSRRVPWLSNVGLACRDRAYVPPSSHGTNNLCHTHPTSSTAALAACFPSLSCAHLNATHPL